MFGFKKKGGPDRPFMHAPTCKIMKADPTTEIPWQEVETGLWVAQCVSGRNTSARRPPTVVLGSTLLTHPLRPGRRVRASRHDRSGYPPGHPAGS
jgi:hypothetical protein